MSGDPQELSESDAQTAAEQDAEEADYRRRRAELLESAVRMRPDEIARMIERAASLERERDDYRAALEEIGNHVMIGGLARQLAREALEPPF